MNDRQAPYRIIGLMSGTSLDGLDIAACEFQSDNIHKFEIVAATCIKYSSSFVSKLRSAHLLSAEEVCELDTEFAAYCGNEVKNFCDLHNFKPDFVSSHGHTVFHKPQKHYTLQVGNPGIISAKCGFPVVGDFRTQDIAFGGQGAPLVPIGDELLFGKYDACLNLGGIANISFRENNSRIAFDICVFNMALNHAANQLGFEFDDKGKIASSGSIEIDLLDALDSLDFYKQPFPKSLGREWFDIHLLPFLQSSAFAPYDIMATLVDHFARQINAVVPAHCKTVLITGGGAFNGHFINRLNHYRPGIWIVPSPELINFKEAIIFAFLGLKRWRAEINCLSSVTGANHDHCAGGIYYSC